MDHEQNPSKIYIIFLLLWLKILPRFFIKVCRFRLKYTFWLCLNGLTSKLLAKSPLLLVSRDDHITKCLTSLLSCACSSVDCNLSADWSLLSAGHTERAMLFHELEDGMYSVTSYFFAKVKRSCTAPVGVSLASRWVLHLPMHDKCVSVLLCKGSYFLECSLHVQVLGELPEHCVFTLVYGLPIYWLAGLNEAPDRFLLNFLMVWLMVYCSRSMALFVAAALPTLQISAFMGNSLFTVFYLTGGFVISLENMWLGEEPGSFDWRKTVTDPQKYV